jgi:hypothetical protein
MQYEESTVFIMIEEPRTYICDRWVVSAKLEKSDDEHCYPLSEKKLVYASYFTERNLFIEDVPTSMIINHDNYRFS